MDMSQYLGLFISETREHLRTMNEAIVALEKEPGDREQVDALFRQAHSIKGMAASMDFGAIAELSHKMEDLMDRVRRGEIPFGPMAADLLLAGADLLDAMVNDVEKGGVGDLPAADLIARLVAHEGERPAAPAEEPAQPEQPAPPEAAAGDKKREAHLSPGTVRVRTDLLDQLVTVTGELVTTRHRFASLGAEIASPGFADAVKELNRLVRELHARVLQARMMPVSGIMDRFPRIVRDLARRNGKEVQLEVEGKEIELDRGILEELGDPLLHILRNAVDHGIETMEERTAAGKPATGTVTIRVRQEKDQVIISVCDDGRGMDPGRILDSALRKGVLRPEEAERLSPREILLLTCLPGFSTAERVTDVSGRGVGMDAVKTSVEKMGGLLAMESEPGLGSSIILKLPRTVAIMNVLLLRVGELTVGLPVPRVLHVLDAIPEEIVSRDGRRFVGEEEIPLCFLREAFALPPSPPRPFLPVAVVDLRGGRGGLVADAILGQQEVFVKPVGRPLESVRGIAGGAVLGDGTGIFIIDAGALF